MATPLGFPWMVSPEISINTKDLPLKSTELSKESLQRKVKFCKELLQLSELFDGGWSIFRGNLLIDLEEAIVAQSLRLEDPKECEAKLKDAAELLQEIANIMKHETEMQQLLADRQQILDAALARLSTEIE